MTPARHTHPFKHPLTLHLALRRRLGSILSGQLASPLILAIAALLSAHPIGAQGQAQPPAPIAESPKPVDSAELIRRIDAAAQARFQTLTGYTVQEHYAIYRNGASTPVAEMTVNTVYQRDTGKQYTPVSQSGSDFYRKIIIDHVLENEHEVNNPAHRQGYWLTSANYDLQPQPAHQLVNGRDCVPVLLHARRKSPYLLDGKMFVDPAGGAVVRLEGSPTQSPSFFAGNSQVFRDYTLIQGFSMATHAEARSHSVLFGDTLLKIDYTGYQLQTAAPNPAPPAR
jgi:hypothetical protein